ncbi:helicase RepA family protein [Luteolibacter sp. Populi]|uniref:helicase RepA family protein n=1 Tax=Luteolibacter sp. Populi TaxID=3230487 RepID=UPI00346715F4
MLQPHPKPSTEGLPLAPRHPLPTNAAAALASLFLGEATSPSRASAPFPAIRADEVSEVSEPRDFVEGLLTEGGSSVVYGPSNCGKSFFVMDLAASVATGQKFRGELETDQGAVLYVALEGSIGVINRIAALKSAGKLSEEAPLFLCFAPVSLMEAGHAERLAATVRTKAEESGCVPRLLVIDTLARAMPGGDENAAKDMTLAIAVADAVRAACGAHVMLIHHTGKDMTKGARGHSSLRAAMDSEIEVTRTAGMESQALVTKQRDLPMSGEPMRFRLEQVELGTNRRGKPITSCVVNHLQDGERKKGRPPVFTSEPLLGLLPATTTHWQRLAKERLGVNRTTFFERRKELVEEGKVMLRGDGLYHPSPAFTSGRISPSDPDEGSETITGLTSPLLPTFGVDERPEVREFKSATTHLN